MSIRTAVRLSHAPIAGLMGVGIFWGGFAAYIPEFKARIGATDAELGLALIGSAVGGIIAMSLGPRLMRGLGRAMLPVASVLLALALACPLLAGSVAGLALALVVMGASVSFLDIGSNMRVSDLEERYGLHLMNLNHAMFSFAFAAAALMATLARRAGWPPEWLFPFLAAAMLALTLLTIEGEGWHAAPDAPDGAGHDGLWGAILPVAAILFLAFVCENATDNWSALHIERTLGGPHGDGGFGPMMLGLTMGIGRLSGQFAAQKLGEAGLIFWSAAVGVLGALVIAAAPSPAVAIFGIGLMGLGVAVTVPSANSILGKLVRADQRGYAISRAWMIGFTGFFIGPSMMGQVAEWAGLRMAFGGVALLMAIILPLAHLIGRSERQL
jgi:MFS family permease